jgi:hypothetical protein
VKKLLFVFIALLLMVPVSCRDSGDSFAVYIDKDSESNHFYPTGLMGDFGDLVIDEGCTDRPHSGNTCIKIKYSAAMSQKAGWAGLFWQQPADNWGKTKEDAYDLTGAKELTFWARGEKGGELVSEFKVGGISGEFGDSGSAFLGMVTLTNEWKKYSIDLDGTDLSYIIGGFCFAAGKDNNPDGFVIYLDDIIYE